MADRRDMERLIHEVTERVLARLGGLPDAEAGPGGRRTVELLLPRAATDPRAFCRQAERLRGLGYPLRVFLSPEAQAQLDAAGLEPRLGPRLAVLGPDAEAAAASDLMVLGPIGFALARRLLEIEDDDVFVRRAVAGLLAGCPLLILIDDLTPADGVGENGLTAEALRLRRELERLGGETLALGDLVARIEGINASDTTLHRALAELVCEADVEGAVASGLRRLALAPHTIVTPLARSRAAELGLELIEDMG